MKRGEEGKKIIVDEDSEAVSVGYKTFRAYFKDYNGGNLFFVVLNFGLLFNFVI